MTRKFKVAGGLALTAAVLFASEGCAFLTAQRVGTFVATQAGKKVVSDMKEDHDQKKQAEAQQQQQQQGSQRQVAQEPQGNGPLEPRPTP